VETLDLLRRTAPRARLIFTAHDFFPLCPQEGQLLTTEGRLCQGPSIDACQRCFPNRPAADFVLRDLSVRDAFRGVDLIMAPSAFARDRFVAAGWPAERFALVPNGIVESPVVPHREVRHGRRDRFGFFGHINRFKGSVVLLNASRRLSEAGIDHRLALNGGSAYQSETFMEEFRAALAGAPAARYQGPYPGSQLGGLMAQVDWVVVPSIWWENAPLVVMEAFRHRRPVICGEVGGMAEMVRDGVDGLHAPVNDPLGLAREMRRAIETEGLWDTLVAGIRPPLGVADTARLHLQHYLGALTQAAA
jgi:glycosyltransferase involved in cell wall biosynthesis